MFQGCTSLNYIKCLATDISASNCLYNWTYNVASTGTFVTADNPPAWTTGTSGIPTNWKVYTESGYKYVHTSDIPVTSVNGMTGAVTGMVTSTTNGLKIEVVPALPTAPDANTIYIVQ